MHAHGALTQREPSAFPPSRLQRNSRGMPSLQFADRVLTQTPAAARTRLGVASRRCCYSLTPTGRVNSLQEGRHPRAAAQRRADGGCCVPRCRCDDLGGPRACRPGVDQPVPQRRRRPSARVCPAGTGRGPVMNAHCFTSALAPEADAYRAFEQHMGCYGASRNWYLRRFDTYCLEHGLADFDYDTVEGGARAAGPIGPVPVLDGPHPRLRPLAAGPRQHGRLRTVRAVEGPVRPGSPLPAVKGSIERFFAAAAHLDASARNCDEEAVCETTLATPRSLLLSPPGTRAT